MIRQNTLAIARQFLPSLRRRSVTTSSWVCDSCRSYSTRRAKTIDPASPARTRFAPSPTGFLHLGSLRTALFNYLLAKRTGGQFLLRIEDTDQKRTVEGAEQALFEILRWAGLQWDEGPEVGGPYGPYRQSERSRIHKAHAETLLATGHAYRCFCSTDRLRALAEHRRALGLTSEYDRTCASIPADESLSRELAGEPHVIRLRVPDIYEPYTDAIYGRIKPGKTTIRHGEAAFEDPILIKQDGLPTYHLANVVDDHMMNITHVIRGMEWMPSTPKHIFMYSAFGWTPPTFCHVGLLQDVEGKKLSKRTGDVHVAEYRAKGYLPEALLNFVALMGWNNRSTSDLLPLEALVENFSLRDLTKGNTKVNFSKLDFLQRAYVESYATSLSKPDFIPSIISSLQTALATTFPQVPEILRSPEYLSLVLDSDLKNYITPTRFIKQHDYFFLPSADFDCAEAVRFREKLTGEDVLRGKEAVQVILTAIKKRENKEVQWDESFLDTVLEVNWPDDKEAHKIVNRNLRYALAGGKSGPGIHKIMMILGEEEVEKRLKGVRWYARGGLVDEKGRVVMTWKEPKEEEEGEDEEEEEKEIEELVRKGKEAGL
ncbi:Glutamate--tRNA ligase mitochondrial [Orbilia ellipsospora]|uniref:Glutamate--tRNA ligase, mitochondrial n=1 Tax=Orbilia ellipsospora TaxID=2528407 RepID=A0AAV9X2B2_9PEZI